MKEVLQALCVFFNWVLEVWNKTGCVILRDVIAPIVGFLIQILSFVIGLFGSGGAGIIDLLNKINSEISQIQCNHQVDCMLDHTDNIGSPEGTLPVSTRCWADYVPGIDSSDALSCSRSDTCTRSPLTSYDDPNVLCNWCPIQTGGYVNQFGCDTSTKKCTCDVPKRDRTLCTSNDQCRIQGSVPSVCALVNDFTTGSSFGGVSCQVIFLANEHLGRFVS